MTNPLTASKKKLFIIPLLAATLALSACGSDDDDDGAGSDTSGATTSGATTSGDTTGGDTTGGDTTGGDTTGGDTTGGDTAGGDTTGGATTGGDTGGGTEEGTTGGDTDGSDPAGGDTGTASTDKAVLVTVASDFSSSAIGIFDSSSPYEGQSDFNPGVSDTIVRTFEDNYYVIRRFMSDSIARYDVTDTATPIFESSTNDEGDEASSNPHDLIFVDASKAYLLRYGSPIVWIVNPSATDASQFKTGELDLSAYDSDGVPEATRGVVVDGRLFIFMQRLTEFAPTDTGVVAVFDTTTDLEIDTGSSGELLGIELPAFNPLDISLDNATNSIFVAAVGDFGAFDGSRPAAFSGGIVTVDSIDFSTSLLIDDTEETGRITAVEIVSANTAYMITETGFGSSTLVSFDPNTGAINETGVAGLADVDLRDITTGPAGNLWVAVADIATPRVVILNPADNTIVSEDIMPALNPTGIAFTQ